MIEAFAAARTVTESRLLLTSRYRFSLPVSRGDAADDLLDLQVPPLTEGQRRKLAWAELSRGLLDAEVSEEAEALAGRALAAAGAIPASRPSSPGRSRATRQGRGRHRRRRAYRASGVMPAGDVGSSSANWR